MKNSYLTFTLVILCSAALLATSSFDASIMKDRMNEGSVMIDQNLSNLLILNEAIVDQNLDFEALSVQYSALVNESNLNTAAAPGILSGHPDVPFGIPGFWWGVACCLFGTLIVYISMDAGTGRKEQVVRSLIGCIVGSLAWRLFWALASIGTN